jgi:hypothetical protein
VRSPQGNQLSSICMVYHRASITLLEIKECQVGLGLVGVSVGEAGVDRRKAGIYANQWQRNETMTGILLGIPISDGNVNQA